MRVKGQGLSRGIRRLLRQVCTAVPAETREYLLVNLLSELVMPEKWVASTESDGDADRLGARLHRAAREEVCSFCVRFVDVCALILFL